MISKHIKYKYYCSEDYSLIENYEQAIKDDVRQKISKANKGHPAWNKGIPHTEEAKRKISKAQIGMKRSEETKRRQSEAMKLSWQRRKGLLK